MLGIVDRIAPHTGRFGVLEDGAVDRRVGGGDDEPVAGRVAPAVVGRGGAGHVGPAVAQDGRFALGAGVVAHHQHPPAGDVEAERQVHQSSLSAAAAAARPRRGGATQTGASGGMARSQKSPKPSPATASTR